MEKMFPQRIEHKEQFKKLYQQEIGFKEKVNMSGVPYKENNELFPLGLKSRNILQGIIFSEIFGKPKGLRRRR